MTSSPILLQGSQLTKRFPVAGQAEVEVFRDLNLTIASGELVTLLGPSGSGKSTLLHLLGTLDRPTSGTIQIEGKDVSSMNDKELSDFRNRRIGFIFQFHHLLPEFTALENVAMPALISGDNFAKAEAHASELLAEVGLSHRLHHRPSALSGGESQRVAVARAFFMQPALILADEPTGNLDLENSRSLFEIIRQLSKKHQQTFLIATHNTDLTKYADRSLLLQDGILTENALQEQETKAAG